MAMEKHYVLSETHNKSITALGYNLLRREILIGCEDGVIKCWEADTGKLITCHYDHKGWITDFLFWSDMKLMLSSAIDGFIMMWGSGGGCVDKIMLGQPVYCMAINPRRQQLICGVSKGILVFNLDIEKESGHYINTEVKFHATEHTDIVRCIVCHESRVYSAGYDHKLIIYDSSYTGDETMVPIVKNNNAHDAGISCLLLVKDNENNTWVVTGSFDKVVKIWSTDGKMVHKLEGFQSTISGICYVPRNKTIWAAGGTSYAYLYDPKSGDNVSDFIGTFQNHEENKYTLQMLKYFPELNQVVGSTSRRHLIVWKYNPSGCVTALKCRSSLESLAYTKKVPILIFSGDHDGIITKWERMQSNHYMYSKEHFLLSEARKAKKKKMESLKLEEEGDKKNKDVMKRPTSQYAHKKLSIPPVTQQEKNKLSAFNHPNTTIVSTLFIEELDYIVAACEDSTIYVWGFDEDAVKALKTMDPPDDDKQLITKYAILLGQESKLLHQIHITEEESVTNRVAGFVCKHSLSEHTSCVTAMAVIGRAHGFDGTYLLTTGWDRRICLWNLEKGTLHDRFRNPSLTSNMEHVELAADGIITDLTYCSLRNEFAYSSSDKMVYIRKFALEGVEMILLNTLQGHFGEVRCVKWNHLKEKWVTGSEDGTIRIWSGQGMNECEQILSAQGSVTALCIDGLNGAIVVGVQEFIRVFDPEQYRLVQTNRGHTDALRSIIHIPERNQYVSSSWDKTIRIWNAWKPPRKKHQTSKENKRGISLNITTESDNKKLNVEEDDEEVGEEVAEEAQQGCD
ncbi:hypothetical protein CAPTEDRAFT_187404 [Capitella teleta]|uniref:Uncharacterized protein n=1 Tax=Capitella teleta TaxID=283909 RepID=R7T7I8_CAPTE|nr:hypothetical protein CAPTEDRAFT_187404 [Capitella teleta]|eukprot:ELT89388.1 hypothetical protein CAPTEDRAFT_187404 [Capitella teleta]